jgi:hypothetical protein
MKEVLAEVGDFSRLEKGLLIRSYFWIRRTDWFTLEGSMAWKSTLTNHK